MKPATRIPNELCGIPFCGRTCLRERFVCGVHAEQIDAGLAVVWNGGELLPGIYPDLPQDEPKKP